MEKDMKQLAIDALIYKYESEKKDAEYVLTNYLRNPIAIGEHPGLLEEMDKALDRYATAEDKLVSLKKIALNDGVE
tara:strand:+ start:8082 stop:8309 length:228 start_codon:yes stop_codon:yes gene_type:complete